MEFYQYLHVGCILIILNIDLRIKIIGKSCGQDGKGAYVGLLIHLIVGTCVYFANAKSTGTDRCFYYFRRSQEKTRRRVCKC